MAKRFQLKTEDWIHDPQSKRQFNEALFAEVAGKYSFVTRVLSFGRDKAWKRKLVAGLPPADQPQCLDLACGTGDITLALADKYSHGTITGLDLCKPMLEIARRRNGHQHVTFVAGDMSQTGLANESIDIVTGGYALRNCPDLEVTLREIYRVMRPGGVAAFLDFSKPPQKTLQRMEYCLLVTWGGLWGAILHGNPEVYAYIPKSLRVFPDRVRLSELLRETGFVRIEETRYLGGITAVTRFAKPA